MSEPIKIKLGIRELIVLTLITGLIFFYFNYSWIGIRLYAMILLLYFLPFYIFLDSFELSLGEKLIFSFFIGLGIVPLLTYYITKLLASFRWSIAVTFVILTVSSFFFRKYHRQRKK
jgi:hypothetical protein